MDYNYMNYILDVDNMYTASKTNFDLHKNTDMLMLKLYGELTYYRYIHNIHNTFMVYRMNYPAYVTFDLKVDDFKVLDNLLIVFTILPK